MEKIIKHINDTNASYRHPKAKDAKNTDLFLDNEHYSLFEGMSEHIKFRLHKDNLSQSILFIASILPRKFDQSSVHKMINFSKDFIYEQLNILDAYFIENNTPVDSIIQVWNARKDIPQKNGKIDTRFYFNGLIQDLDFVNEKGEHIHTKFTIRNYLAGGYSNLHIQKAENDIFDVYIENTTKAYDDFKEDGYEEIQEQITSTDLYLQQIYYGAPGTGKSHTINSITNREKANTIRTTFHPDTDYSSFVGAYKPTTIEEPVMTVIGTKAVPVENADGSLRVESKIVYEFVSQSFLKAYVNAWKLYSAAKSVDEIKKQYLVIEEINRGNCAQIFGDLFQLLDRNDSGFSDYPIAADADMQKQLRKAFSGLDIPMCDAINTLYDETGRDIVGEVLDGKILLLPNNLYIWATMNTSDQSLFPIDSAFKRRWDWEYMPISNAGKNWTIDVNGSSYDWWQFLEAINELIGSTTFSEDKKLGYFFCKAVDGVISAEKFVGKVIFYLWNDVFKDYGFDSAAFSDADEGGKLSFDKFYMSVGNINSIINEEKVEIFLRNLGLEPKDEAEEKDAEKDYYADGYIFKRIKVLFEGEEIYEDTSIDTFIKTIEKIGLERVANLGLKISSYELLSKSKLENETPGGYGKAQRQLGDYWLITKYATSAKINYLKKIKTALNLDLEVTLA